MKACRSGEADCLSPGQPHAAQCGSRRFDPVRHDRACWTRRSITRRPRAPTSKPMPASASAAPCSTRCANPIGRRVRCIATCARWRTWSARSRTPKAATRRPPISPEGLGRVDRGISQAGAGCGQLPRCSASIRWASSDDESSPSGFCARRAVSGPFDHIEDAGFRDALAGRHRMSVAGTRKAGAVAVYTTKT